MKDRSINTEASHAVCPCMWRGVEGSPVLHLLLGHYPAGAQQQGGGGHLRGSGAHAQQQVAAERAQRRPQRHHGAKQSCMQALPLSVPSQLTAFAARLCAVPPHRQAALHAGTATPRLNCSAAVSAYQFACCPVTLGNSQPSASTLNELCIATSWVDS